jgi:hypothetical protein
MFVCLCSTCYRAAHPHELCAAAAVVVATRSVASRLHQVLDSLTAANYSSKPAQNSFEARGESDMRFKNAALTLMPSNTCEI